MKRFTRILSLLLAVLMVIGLTACGGGDNPSTNAPSNDPAGSNGTPADGNTGDSGEQSCERNTPAYFFRSLSAGKLGSPSYDIMEGRRKARPGRRARFLPRHF